MFNSMREELETTVAPLIREIVEDTRKLVRQEAELVKAEVREDTIRLQRAFTYVVLGSAALFIAVLLGALMVVYALAEQWIESPLWFSFGIVAVIMSLLGAGFSYGGLRKLRSIRESSGRSIDAVREGFAWMQRTM